MLLALHTLMAKIVCREFQDMLSVRFLFVTARTTTVIVAFVVVCVFGITLSAQTTTVVEGFSVSENNAQELFDSEIDVGQDLGDLSNANETFFSGFGNEISPGNQLYYSNGSSELEFAETDATSSRLNFNEFPKSFGEGLTIQNDRWAAKIGGYTKADLIHDFDAIGSRDTFDPMTIEVGAPERSTSRFHARQTRLSLDTRWLTDSGAPLRIMIEADFFGDGDTLRLRHAYGEYQGLIVGQTWSTFAHRGALPNTLDVVRDVASVGRRQAQIRWTKSWMDERWSFSAALEDSRVLLDDNLAPFGDARSIAPDAIARVRFTSENAQLQLGALYRRLGFQLTGGDVIDFNGSGLNATAYVDLTEATRLYGGMLWGSGIGSYRNLPDIAIDTPGRGKSLDSLSWYSGVHHQWNKKWSSNFTFSDGVVENTPRQDESSVRRLQYMAANLIWQPTPYTFSGTELLWGMRKNKDRQESDAHRIMVSFGFLLP